MGFRVFSCGVVCVLCGGLMHCVVLCGFMRFCVVVYGYRVVLCGVVCVLYRGIDALFGFVWFYVVLCGCVSSVWFCVALCVFCMGN